MTTEEIIKLRQQLDCASNELNKRIAQFEKDLQTLGMGVQVWIPISEGTQLGYVRYQGTWRVCVKYNDTNSPDEPLLVIKPLDRCERGLRYHGYKNISKLVPAIEVAGKSLLTKINEALDGDSNADDSGCEGRLD